MWLMRVTQIVRDTFHHPGVQGTMSSNGITAHRPKSRIADREFEACDADENYNPMPSSAASTWPEDEPLVEDVNMNAFRDDLAHALFHGV